MHQLHPSNESKLQHQVNRYPLRKIMRAKIITCQLPFELKSRAKLIRQDESTIMICESKDICHLFEVNEYQNIIDHQVFTLTCGIEMYSTTCVDNEIFIYDGCIKNEIAYVVSSIGVTRYQIYQDNGGFNG